MLLYIIETAVVRLSLTHFLLNAFFVCVVLLVACLQIQMVINENLFPLLLEVLSKAEPRTRKEAAWALSNAACGGNAEQLRYF